MFVFADLVPKVEHHLAKEPFLRNDVAVVRLDEEFAELLVFGFGEVQNLIIDGIDKILPRILRTVDVDLIIGGILAIKTNRHILPIEAALERAIHGEQRLVAGVHRSENVQVRRELQLAFANFAFVICPDFFQDGFFLKPFRKVAICIYGILRETIILNSMQRSPII